MPQYKRQHYLPQFYLKGFSINFLLPPLKRDQDYLIWYYNKKSRRVNSKPVKKIAVKNYLYSWKVPEGSYNVDIEKILSQSEAIIAPVINKIHNNIILLSKSPRSRKSKKLLHHDEEDWSILIEFLLMMIRRIPKTIKKVFNDYKKYLEENMETDLSDTYVQEIKKGAVITSMMIGDGSGQHDLFDTLAQKNLFLLYIRSDKASFITSDNPVTRFRPKGDNGWKYEDTEIYLPLSQKCLLMFTGINDGKVHYRPITDTKVVSNWNKYFASFSEEIVIGRDEALMKSIMKKDLQYRS